MITKLKQITKKTGQHWHRLAHFSGLKRASHEIHSLTLKRLILLACGLSLAIVVASSWMFYSDPRSKYDLVRPGRRVLPQEFRADQSVSTSQEKTGSDVKLQLESLRAQLEGLKIYGDFRNDGLSDSKILQSYLDEPVVE